MTAETEKPFDALPICACAEFYDSHPPDCPVRRHIEQQSAEIARLESALRELADWPDGGNRYGQANMKRFAREALSAQPS